MLEVWWIDHIGLLDCLFSLPSVCICVGIFAQKICALSRSSAAVLEQMRHTGFQLPVGRMEESVQSEFKAQFSLSAFLLQ